MVQVNYFLLAQEGPSSALMKWHDWTVSAISGPAVDAQLAACRVDVERDEVKRVNGGGDTF